jgi:hypothetical protein
MWEAAFSSMEGGMSENRVLEEHRFQATTERS